jgi:hypothetical protein
MTQLPRHRHQWVADGACGGVQALGGTCFVHRSKCQCGAHRVKWSYGPQRDHHEKDKIEITYPDGRVRVYLT